MYRGSFTNRTFANNVTIKTIIHTTSSRIQLLPKISHNLISTFIVVVIAATKDNTTVSVNLRGSNIIPSFVLNCGEAFQYLADAKYRQTSLGKEQHCLCSCGYDSILSLEMLWGLFGFYGLRLSTRT